MREIKFRAKSLSDEIGLISFQFSDIQKWIQDDNTFYVHDEPCLIDTVQQYTGLKDKTGVEIYEGDIIEGIRMYHADPFSPSNPYTLVKETGQVKYVDCMFMLWNENEYDRGMLCFYDTIEILGDIYSDPKLQP